VITKHAVVFCFFDSKPTNSNGKKHLYDFTSTYSQSKAYVKTRSGVTMDLNWKELLWRLFLLYKPKTDSL
jgi:hypothetical protein